MSGLAGRGPNGLAGGGRQPASAFPERNGTPCLRPRPGLRRAASDSCHQARRGGGGGSPPSSRAPRAEAAAARKARAAREAPDPGRRREQRGEWVRTDGAWSRGPGVHQLLRASH